MDIPSKYDPSATEDKWYSYWLSQGYFRSPAAALLQYISPPLLRGELPRVPVLAMVVEWGSRSTRL